jgi:hypothetical protein
MGGGFIEGVRRGEIMVASKGMRQHLEAQNSGAQGGARGGGTGRRRRSASLRRKKGVAQAG